MPSPAVLLYGPTGEIVSSVPRVPDGQEQRARLMSRGELAVMNLFNDAKALVTEGSYFVAGTPTPGTGITLSVATGVSFADTQGLIGIDNTDTNKVQGGQGKTIHLDFAMWVVTTAPTSSTDHQIAHRVDGSQNRSSGGTAVVPKNVNTNYGNATVASVIANPTLTAINAANARHFGRMFVRKAAAPNYIVGDVVVVKFGGIEWSAALANVVAAAQTIVVVPAPAIAIGPGGSYVMNEWATARTAALSGELFVGYVER